MSAAPPVQRRAEVVSVAPAGAYLEIALRLPEPGACAFRPGQFAALAVGGESSSMLLRRCFSIYRVDGDVLRIVFAAHGGGTRWLAARRPGDVVDVVAPLGTPFSLPTGSGGSAVLVGGGYGSAPLFSLASSLRDMDGAVHFVLGAASADRLFGVSEAARLGDTVTVTTDDGSAGTQGWVTDVLPAVLASTGGSMVYACGPMEMLRAVSGQAAAAGAAAQVAVEEAMACGIGVCMTCVLPVVGPDGVTRMTRSCVDGPVFDGAVVRWPEAATGAVPADALGALAMGAR